MAITVAPGQVVSSGDWDALFKQHGGMPNNQQAILRPPTKQEQDAAFAAETDDFDQRPIYRYTLADGSYVDARTSKDGAGWEVIEYKPSAKFTASNPATPSSSTNPAATAGATSNVTGTPTAYDAQGRPTAWDNSRPVRLWTRPDGTVIRADPLAGDERDRWEKEKNQAAGLGAKTDAEVEKDKPRTDEATAAVPSHPGWRVKKTVKVENGNRVETTVYIDPQDNEHATLPEKPGDVKSTFQTINGQRYEVRATPQGAGKPDKIEYFDPSGKPIAQLPTEAGTKKEPVTGKPGIVKVTKNVGNDTETWYEDDKGNRVPTPTDGVGNLPPDFPRYTPDLTKRGQGLIEYQQAVDQWMAANPGKLTWENRQKVMADAIGMAQVVTGEFNVAAGILREAQQNAISQRGQDITQAGQRLSAANQGVQQALATLEKLGPYLGATPGDAGKLFVGLQAAQMAHGTLMGGMREVPRVELDQRMGAFADRTLGPAPGVPGAPAASGAPPTAAPAAAPTAPTPPPMTREHAMANPVFRPQPPVDGSPMTNLPQGPGDQSMMPEGDWFTPTGPRNPLDNVLTPGRPIEQFDGTPGTGPGADVGPVSAMPDPLNRLSVLPETPSWHERAQAQMFRMEPPTVAAPSPFLTRGLPPTFSPGGGGGLGFGQFSLPRVPTQIAGLTPELDEQARREVLAEMGAA